MNTQTLDLDLSKNGLNTSLIRLGQGDRQGTTIKAYIYDNAQKADLTGLAGYLTVLLPNKVNYVRQKATISENVATVVLDEDKLCAVPGFTDEAYFMFVNSDESVKYSTERFSIEILRSALEGKVPAENWDNAIEDLIDRGTDVVVENEKIIPIEAERVAAEAQRIADEAARVAAEAQRIASEAARTSSEETRVSNEATRVANEAARVASFAEIEQRSKGWLRYYCTTGEYNTTTRKPTVTDPDTATLYFVPSANPDDDNQWLEWMWDAQNEKWEVLGTTQATVSPVTVAQIDAIANDESVQGSEVVNTTGLTYLWSKIKAKFAALVHKHAASDITSGTLDAARIADGSISIDKLDQSTRDSIFQAVDFANRSISNLLQVSLNERDAEINKPCKISTVNAGTLTNRAPDMPTSGAFMAMREVHWFSVTHVLVVITEAYPVSGRIWANFYNINSWDGWQMH